jgi:O-antigen/teichoic acid export membrane protein
MYFAGNQGILRATFINWVIVLIGLGVAQIAPGLALILVARQVSPTEYGQYASCFGLLSLLIVLPSYGMDTWLLMQGGARSARLQELWNGVIRFRVGLLSVWLVVVIGLGFWLPHETFPFEVLLPTAIGLALDSLTFLAYAGLRVLGRHKTVTGLQVVGAIALLGITLALPFGSRQIELFAVGRMIVSALTAALVLVVVRKILVFQSVSISVVEIARSANPFMFAELAASAYMRIDIALISLVIGISGSALYGPAINLINMTFLVPNALYLFVLPVLSNQFVRSPRLHLRISIAQLIVQGLSGALISLLVLFTAPVLIQVLFGNAYAFSLPLLYLLSPIPFFKALNFGLGAILTSVGHQTRRTLALASAAIFSLAGMVVVIVPFAAAGVAITHTLGEVFLFAGYALIFYSWWVNENRQHRK